MERKRLKKVPRLAGSSSACVSLRSSYHPRLLLRAHLHRHQGYERQQSRCLDRGQLLTAPATPANYSRLTK